MSSDSNLCQVCKVKSVYKKLYVQVCLDHYNIGKEELRSLLIKLIENYKKEQERPPIPTPIPSPQTPNSGSIDKYGIEKIYPDATEKFQHWYMKEDNPTSDPKFGNHKNSNLKRMQDGSN